MDWMLAAHQVAPLQYEMGGMWNPVSVRDQMVRGQEIARRAAIAGLIRPDCPSSLWVRAPAVSLPQ